MDIIFYTIRGADDGHGNYIASEAVTLHWRNGGNECFVNAADFEALTQDWDVWDIEAWSGAATATATLED